MKCTKCQGLMSEVFKVYNGKWGACFAKKCYNCGRYEFYGEERVYDPLPTDDQATRDVVEESEG